MDGRREGPQGMPSFFQQYVIVGRFQFGRSKRDEEQIRAS